MLGKAEVVILKQTLKKQMKRQKRSYSELAAHWDCSEVTAKRVMNKEELSLSRLASLLKWLELEFSDLTLLMEKEKQVTRHKFSEEAENYFDKNSNHLAFYIELFGDESTEEIAKRYGFSDSQLTKVMKKLDELGLIRWQEGFNRQVVSPELPLFIPRGKLQKRYYKKAITKSSQLFLERTEKQLFALKEPEETGGYSFLSFELSPSTYAEATKQLKKMLNDLELKSRQERLVHSKDELKQYAFVQGFTPLDETNNYEHFIRDVFGEDE